MAKFLTMPPTIRPVSAAELRSLALARKQLDELAAEQAELEEIYRKKRAEIEERLLALARIEQ